MNTWRDYISHKIDVSKELDADLNFPKIHLMSHWVEQICQFGVLQQYSSERHQQAHKTNLNDGWNASNHNLNYLLQVITFQLASSASKSESSISKPSLSIGRTALPHALSSIPVLIWLPPLSPQSYAKPEFMRTQNCHDGKHPDAMIKDFRALLDNTQDATHRVAIYSGTREFIKHKSRNKTYISDEQLHEMELCIYHGIKVQVEG